MPMQTLSAHCYLLRHYNPIQLFLRRKVTENDSFVDSRRACNFPGGGPIEALPRKQLGGCPQDLFPPCFSRHSHVIACLSSHSMCEVAERVRQNNVKKATKRICPLRRSARQNGKSREASLA